MGSKVSMVVPCYNKEEYIGEMLESVYNQVWDNIEVILVYDISPDNTRDIIYDWEPKLRERGYEVVIIERERRGLPAAVRDGILRMTGEYFCTADCDDVLEPEYASAMAGWLDENPECQWVHCNYASCGTSLDDPPHKSLVYGSCLEDARERLNHYLLGNVGAQIWSHMVRKEYIDRCRIIERFSTPKSGSQELMLLIPMCFYGGKLKHIDRVLYRYRVESSGTGRSESGEVTLDFLGRFYADIIKELRDLDASEKEREYLIWLSQFYHKHTLMSCSRRFGIDCDELVREVVGLANESLTPYPRLKSEDLTLAKLSPFLRALQYALLGITPAPAPAPPGRIIGYGVLGKIAQRYLPLLEDTQWRPGILWDKSAKPESCYNDRPVEKPSFDGLLPDDTILVFPIQDQIFSEILRETQKYPVKNIFRYREITDIISNIYYPELIRCRPKNPF